MIDESAKAKILLEALPYIREFAGRHMVIKYGGHAMIDETLKQSFVLNVILLKYVGVKPVIVHGGGPQIGKMLQALSIDTQFREGYRITDEATMDVVEMVLVGQVNKSIVNLFNLHGARAVGLSGKDGELIKASKMELAISKADAPPEIIDLGKVGRVEHVNTPVIRSLENEGFIPVIAPVGVDDSGETYNINADYVASALAGSLGAKRLILLTDVPGLLDPEGNLISTLTGAQALDGIDRGEIKGGMIPKVKCCLEAVHQAVEKAQIIDGRMENSLLLELFTKAGVGTQIVR
ncbi:MAG: acetylglutamate kinase [Desulfovibrionaceae bacterium]